MYITCQTSLSSTYICVYAVISLLIFICSQLGFCSSHARGIFNSLKTNHIYHLIKFNNYHYTTAFNGFNLLWHLNIFKEDYVPDIYCFTLWRIPHSLGFLSEMNSVHALYINYRYRLWRILMDEIVWNISKLSITTYDQKNKRCSLNVWRVLPKKIQYGICIKTTITISTLTLPSQSLPHPQKATNNLRLTELLDNWHVC